MRSYRDPYFLELFRSLEGEPPIHFGSADPLPQTPLAIFFIDSKKKPK
jgi:hypothetical protein